MRCVSLAACILCSMVAPTYAGGFRSSCNTCASTYVAPNYNVVQKVASIQFVPTFVSFVPSQVLLNGQVTSYGHSGASVGYSYQGPVAQPPQGQPQQDQNGSVDPNPVQVQSKDPNARLDRIEKLLEKLISGEVAVESTAAPEVKGIKDHDAVAFLTARCVKCHIPGGAGSEEKIKGGYTFFTAEGQLKEKLNRMRIYESIDSGLMPKNGKTEPHTREAVRLWLQDGLKNLEF